VLMGLVKEWKSDSGASLWLWDLNQLPLQNYNISSTIIKGREKEQALISSLKAFLHPTKSIVKDEYGKPYLNPQETQINYSHAGEFLLWGEHSSFPIGVDIESKRPQLEKIAHKFCSERELAEISGDRLSALLAIWTCKEAMYKAYGKKEVDYRDQFYISPFELKEEGTIQAQFLLGKKIDFSIEYCWIEGYLASWTLYKP